MRLGNGRWVDAGPRKEVFARYLNDARKPVRYNCWFEKVPTRWVAVVRALRDISNGEELFVSYGKWYWSSRKEGSKAPQPLAT